MRIYALDSGQIVYLLGEAGEDLMPREKVSGPVHSLRFDEATNVALAAHLSARPYDYTLIAQQLARFGVPAVIALPRQAWLDEEAAAAAKVAFRGLPDWATWTAVQASAYVHSNVLGGWDKAQLDAYVDANVTTIATARTALKQLGEELIDLRAICERLAEAVVYLRDVAVRRVG
jgi:hypothetical protein